MEELGEEDAGRLVDQLEAFEQQQQRDLLQLGAAGRLLMAGKIKAVAPLEEVATYQAANPVTEDGAVILDRDRIEARQTAQAKLLLADGEFSLIVLGGAHDLSDNLDRLSGGQVEYIRVATKRWLEFVGDVGEGATALLMPVSSASSFSTCPTTWPRRSTANSTSTRKRRW